MTNQGLSKFGLYALDRLTDSFPNFLPRIFQKIFLTILGSQTVYAFYQKRYSRKLKQVKSFNKILIVTDVNIGDAVMIQQIINAMKSDFPNAKIDYLCNRSGGELLLSLPGVNHVYGIFRGNGVPLEDELRAIREIVRSTKYSVIINMCPFISKMDLKCDAPVLHLYIPYASYILRLWKLKKGQMHFSAAVHVFLRELLAPFAVEKRSSVSPTVNLQRVPYGNSIYLSHKDIEFAKEFLADNSLLMAERLMFFNINATSRYTQIPLELQIGILRKTLQSEDIDAALLTAGHPTQGLEQTILEALPWTLQKKVVVVPHMHLGAFAALIDACDVFLSSDTGPTHIAASWKVGLSTNDAMRNRTSVVTVFGATDSRMYGYDSERPDHIPANQNVPSKVFLANAPCRNITCINKLGKTCKEIRCFHGLDPDVISGYIISRFHHLSNQVMATMNEIMVE
jgi:ADP-heptose:LPS heptosyltransferase